MQTLPAHRSAATHGSIARRTFLQTAAASAATVYAAVGVSQPAGQFSGRIRKSLKWNMVQQAKDMPLVEAFRKLKDCGFEGVEPRLNQVDDASAWLAASKESGLVIDGTVAARTENLEVGIDLTKQLGGDSMLVENVWATFLISAFDMARFIDEIDSPWVQVHFDVGNMVRWGVAEHWAEILGTRTQKLDIKEYDLKKAMNEGMAKGFDVPLGEGSINWPAVRTELAKINFTGWAAAEVRGGDWEYLTDVARRMDQVLDLQPRV